MGMAATLLDPRGLIDVEQRRADEEERREDEVGEHSGHGLPLPSEAMDEDQEEVATYEIDESDRDEPGDRVDEICPRELPATTQGGSNP